MPYQTALAGRAIKLMDFLSKPIKPIKKEPTYPLTNKKKAVRSLALLHLFLVFDLPFLVTITTCSYLCPKHHYLLFWSLALGTTSILYLGYLLRLYQLIIAAPLAFKKHKNHIHLAINTFNRQQLQFVAQKKSYQAFINQLPILQFDLFHLKASAKKLQLQQQLHAFLSQFPLELAAEKLTAESLAQFNKLGVFHLGELDKINTVMNYYEVGINNYQVLLLWRKQVLKGFEFEPQPYSLAKIQKRLRKELKSAISRFPKQRAKRTLLITAAYQNLQTLSVRTLSTIFTYRLQRNLRAYLVCIGSLIDYNYDK